VLHSLVTGIVVWASRRRGLVAGGVLGALAVSMAGALQLTFDTDVLSLLPRDGRAVPAFRDYLSRIGNLDQLFVVFTAPEGFYVDDYEDEIQAWISALRAAPEIARVDTGVADASRNLEWLADRRLLLLRGDRLDDALRRLEPAGLPHAVAESRELLSVPSPQVADMVRYDPAGLFGLVRESLGGAQSELNLGVAAGGYVSDDNRNRLVIARPVSPPFDAAFSRALDARLRRITGDVRSRAGSNEPDDEPLPPLTVQFAGGYRVAVETESIVRRESIFNTVSALVLILPLLFLIYRSFWLVAVGALPSAFSLAIVLGALGFGGAQLSAAATGASAMLFGLGVDGVVLLYVAYLLRTSGGAPFEASALGGASTSMLLGMWTTAATFYGLTFVDFPSLQQLGRLIGHSMLLCGVLTLLMIPALLPRRAPARRPRALTMPGLAAWTGRHRVAIIVAAAAATAGLGAASAGLRIDPTLDRLRSATPASQLEARIAEMFGLPSDVYIALSEGPDLDALLQADDRLASRVAAEIPGLSFQPPSRLLPPETVQERTAARIASSGLSPASVSASLERARAEAGFKPGSFDPFVARLPHLLDPALRVTYEGYVTHGLGDLVERFVTRHDGRWTTASYFFPTSREQVQQLESIVAGLDAGQRLTGLPLVNRELAARFVPEFAKGLAIGTVMVVILVAAAFRSWRLSLFALLPTAVGLVWTAGLLALAGVELDLFAMFAVVTFLGIGVDYGIHLVHRYHEHGDAARATSELAPVIFVAGAITVFGYGTLVNSSYPPLRSIGIVSAVSVFALAAASVLMLPALLQMGRRP
jgi:predicted RND superfamily exporter protein